MALRPRYSGQPLSRRAFVGAAGAAVLAAGLGPQTARGQDDLGRRLQIWFIRHAESEINVPNSPRPLPDGGMSYPLTLKGVEQAKVLAESLASAPILAIHTSTHLRAVQTADAIAFKRNLTLQLAPEAIEIDLGVKEGDDVRAVYMELARKWTVEKDFDARHGEGESFADVQRRFLPFVRELMNRHALDDGVVVIMAHSATLGFMTPVLAGNIPADFPMRHPLPNTGVIKTELRDSKLYCTEWAGIPSSQFTSKPEIPSP
jgi:2,3-bisphosphoglycerate-dependent phosphoglycerate mutase